MNSHLKRFNGITERLMESERIWHESRKAAEWEDFKEGYREERFKSKRRYLESRPSKATHQYSKEEIESMAKGDREVRTYGYEKGRLTGIAHDLMTKGAQTGCLSWALTGALLYEKLGYGKINSVKNRVMLAHEKNVEGRPYHRLSTEDITELRNFLERNTRVGR